MPRKSVFSMASLFLAISLLHARPAGTGLRDIVNWTFSVVKISDQTYEIHMTPAVQAPWHIYSQSSPETGALPTKIKFGKNPLVRFDGPVKEIGKMISKYEEVFDTTVNYFEGPVDFVQVITVKGRAKTNITGTVEFMVCNDEQCRPPSTIPFTLSLP